MGWTLRLALEVRSQPPLLVRVPARFEPAVEALLEAGARIQATLVLYAQGIGAAFDRCLLGAPNLP